MYNSFLKADYTIVRRHYDHMDHYGNICYDQAPEDTPNDHKRLFMRNEEWDAIWGTFRGFLGREINPKNSKNFMKLASYMYWLC